MIIWFIVILFVFGVIKVLVFSMFIFVVELISSKFELY